MGISTSDSHASRRPPAPSDEPTIGDSEVQRLAGSEADDPFQEEAMRGRIAGRLFGEDAVAPGETRVGRFVLGEVVGAGAMGVVHAAFDETLERKVAIKLILGARTRSEAAQSRLLREAQAMARVSHAHVIPVYEAGTYPGGVFVAMEYVEGGTLREWLAANPDRTWSETLAVLLQAGEGLAAAHREGIVHRDFKPDNVMVTASGEPKVGDFGLAGFAETPVTSSDGVSSGQSALTQTGAVVGTPVYMPPERFEAKPATAQSDQFAFCVVVFEALFGTRPFAGATAAELTTNVLEGNVREVPGSSRVPRDVRAAVLRGLATDPADRWPSMDALLAALGKTSARGRTWAAAGILVAVAGGSAWAFSAGNVRPCQGAQAQLEGTWDAARRGELSETYTAVDTPFAQEVWSRAEPRLAAFGEAWVEAHTQACEMTRVSGEQSEAVLDLRMGCLRRARLGFAATLEVLATPDPEVLANTERLASELPDIARCADVERLQQGGPIAADPDGPELEQVEQVERLVARSRALRAAGAFDAALDAGLAARTALAGHEAAPASTDVALAIGNAYLASEISSDAQRELLAAQRSASRHGQWEEAVEAATLVAFALGARDTRFAEAHLTLELAEGLAQRVGSNRTLALLDERRAGVLSHEGRYDEALAAYASSLARWNGADVDVNVEAEAEADAEVQDNARRRLVTRRSVAVTLERAGRFEEAEAEMRAVVQAQIAALGPNHPWVARARKTLAGILVRRRRFEEAATEFAAARAVWEATLPKHPGVASLDVAAASALLQQGEFAAAVRANREALETWAPMLGPDHETMLAARSNLSSSLASLGQLENASREMTALVDAAERAFGAEHPRTIRARSNLTELLLVLGELDRAETVGRQALASALKRDPQSASVGKLRGKLGSILMDQGRATEALAEYEAARDLLVEVLEPGDTAIAQVRNNLGDFLRKHDRPQDAAVEFGAALRVMETGGLGEHPSAAQILVNLAWIEMDTGDLDAACDKLERAVAIHRAGTGSAAARGEAQFVLAQCLTKRGGDKARVSALVNAALDDYGTIPAERSEPWRAQVESFMSKHRIKRQPPR